MADDKAPKLENPFKKLAREEFTIPNMIAEREATKQKEYEARASVEVKELGLKEGELSQMKELDFMYGGKTTQEELDDIQEEQDAAALDPYLKKKERYIKPQ